MNQIQEYLVEDNAYHRGRIHARFTSIPNLITVARHFAPPKQITLAYLVMTCVHESGDHDNPMIGCAWNERDTEPDGQHYYGVPMISDAEARRYGRTGPQMHDPLAALEVLCNLATDHLAPILRAAGRAATRGLPFIVGDVPAYLAYAHNAGLGRERTPIPGQHQGALESIFVYGLDWSRFEHGNSTMPIVAHRYGRDCIDGGKLGALLQKASSAP